MPEKINFNNTINSSLQIGDIAYVAEVSLGGVTTEPILVGNIISVGNGYIIVDKDPTVYPVISPNMFILFSKPIQVEESGLKGYYANVTFENNSKTPVELFAISSEASISSK